jgi:hypothetical protein
MVDQSREERTVLMGGVAEFAEVYVLRNRALLAGSWDVEKMSMSGPG